MNRIKRNEQEKPQASFLKYTVHTFLKQSKSENRSFMYEVTASNKKHEIGQLNSLKVNGSLQMII